MAHYLTNNEKFHIFSKSPVLSSMAVSQAVNKSGHTVSTNDVWADDVPWFTEVADEPSAITRAADARYNDLILWGSDIYVRKGDKTNGASTGTTFAELWEKHTDLTEARAYALDSVTTQTPTNIVTKTVELKNASDKVVLKYHVGKQIDLLTTANNANVASTWAARMFIDGKVVDQFVSPTDKVFAGNPSTGYTTLVYTATAAGNKYGFVTEGEANDDFVNNAFAGIVQFNTSRNDTHKFAASVFEYVGDKLDSTVAKLSAAVFGSGGGEPGEQPTDLVTQVNQNTAALTTLNGDVNTNGSIAQKIKAAIDALGDVAVKSDIKITDIKVKVGSGEATSLTPDANKSVTVEIPEVQAATTSVAGVVTISSDAAIESTASSTSAATVTAVAATRGAIEQSISSLSGRVAQLEGIAHFSVVVVPDGQTIENVTPLVENTIYLVKDANAAEGTYIEYIAYKPAGSETVVSEKIGSTAIDLSGYTTDAEHTALAGRVTTVEGKVTTLESQVATLNGSATTAGSVAKALADAKSYAEEQASAAQSAAESNAAAALTSALEQVAEDIEAAKNEAISSAEVTITAGTGIVVTPEGKGTTFEIAVSDDVATAASVTALSEVVASNKTELDGKITAAQTTLQGNIDGVSGRVTTVEGKVTTLEGQVAELTTGDSSVDNKIANAVETIEGDISDAVSTLEGKITTAQNTADGKVASVTVTDTTGTISTGGTTTAPVFTVTGGVISDAETKFVSGSTVKTYVDGQVSAAKSEIKTTTDALAQDIQSIKDVIGEGENGENIIDILSGIRTDLDATTATANTAAQSAEGDTYVSASQTDTKITVATNIAAITSHVDTELVKTGTAVANAISGVQTAVEGKSLASTSTGSTLVSITTAGTVGAGMTTTVDTTALATAISTAESNAISAAEAAAKAMALNASDSDDAAKVTVTLGGTVETPTITVTSSDIASAATLSDLVSTVNTHISEAAGLYLSVEKVDVLPADTDAKTNKIYLVPVDTEAGREQNIHTEYIWTNNKWEIIGTTAIDMNSLEAAAEAAQAAADAAQADVDALSQTHATDKTALEGSISAINTTISAMDATETVNGLTVTQVDGKITGLSEALITASVPAGTTSVEGNVAYVGSTKHVIAPEKFQTAAQMPSTLTSWVADLSNLTNGDNMFKGCTGLTVFVGDLSALTSGVDMFNGCTLDDESLEILSENLPTVSGGTIDIGAQTNATDEVISTIKNKGWTLKSNGVAL